MQEENVVLLDIKNSVAIITLNRPDRLNAFNEQVHIELDAHLTQCENDDTIRAIILTGAGRGFCAGQDLKERIDDALDKFYNPLILRLRNMPKPIVCAVNGVAAGGGAPLALACDIIVASEEAKFVQAFSKIALVPDCGATWFLPHYVGELRAKYLMLLDEPITAQEGLQMGMVNKVVPKSEVMKTAQNIAEKLAKGPSVSYGLIKSAVQQAGKNTLKEQLDLERKNHLIAHDTEDHEEGVQAFIEKRPPQFKGR